MTNNYNNIEERLRDAAHAVQSRDLNSAHARVEMRLRSQWKNNLMNEQKVPMPKRFFTKTRLVYGGASVAVILLAIISTASIEQSRSRDYDDVAPTTANADYSELNESLGSSDSSGVSGFFEKEATTESAPDTYQPVPVKDEMAQEQQVFQTDVSLKLDVDKNVLDTIQQIQSHLSEVNGYLISTNYTANTYAKASGTVYVKVPVDQLPTFQQYLSTIDTNGELDVLSYNVQNMSEQVAQIDETIKNAQAQIDSQKKVLSETQNEYERNSAQQIIQNQQLLMEQYKKQREETVAKYSLANVSILLSTKEHRQWDDVSSIDQSTFWGEVKYEFVNALSSLVDTLGSLVIFMVWIIVYSSILVPLILIVRWVMRWMKKRKQ